MIWWHIGSELALTRAGVRINDSYASPAGVWLEESLLGAIVASTGQAGEVEQHGHFLRIVGDGLWREVQVQCHFASGRRGIVGEFE